MLFGNSQKGEESQAGSRWCFTTYIMIHSGTSLSHPLATHTFCWTQMQRGDEDFFFASPFAYSGGKPFLWSHRPNYVRWRRSGDRWRRSVRVDRKIGSLLYLGICGAGLWFTTSMGGIPYCSQPLFRRRIVAASRSARPI